MTAPELPHAPEADAVGAPVERPVRPCAWVDERSISWLEVRAGKAGAFITTPLAANGPSYERPMPLYTQAALDAAVAAERERWECVQRDHQRLVRELDAALNGADRAAPQASLCDLVSQVHRMVRDGLIVGA